MPRKRRQQLRDSGDAHVNRENWPLLETHDQSEAQKTAVDKGLAIIGAGLHEILNLPGKLTGHSLLVAQWLRQYGFAGVKFFGGPDAKAADISLKDKCIAGSAFAASALLSFWAEHSMQARQTRRDEIRKIYEEIVLLDDMEIANDEFFNSFDELVRRLQKLNEVNDQLLPRIKDFCLHFINATQNSISTSFLAIITAYEFFFTLPETTADYLFISLILASTLDGFMQTVKAIREEYRVRMQCHQLVENIRQNNNEPQVRIVLNPGQ